MGKTRDGLTPETIEIKNSLHGFIVVHTMDGVVASQMSPDWQGAINAAGAYLRPEWSFPCGNC